MGLGAPDVWDSRFKAYWVLVEELSYPANICIYIYIYPHIHIYIYTYIHKYTQVCIYIYIHVCIYIHINIYYTKIDRPNICIHI